MKLNDNNNDNKKKYQTEVLSTQINLIDNKIKKDYNKKFYEIFLFFVNTILSIFGIFILILFSIILKIIKKILKDDTPLFYTQIRIGKNGKEFKLYKFQSMENNADEILFNLMKTDPEIKKEYEKNKKLQNDPRITKLGKIIRKTSIDEIPQVLNIFLGQMNIIGPRPYLPREKDDMGHYFNEITSVKPGLTGYWQTKGRSNTDFKERLEMDLYYVKNRSFIFDFKIFFKTFSVVLGKKGAK